MISRGSFLELAAAALFGCDGTQAPPSPAASPDPQYRCTRNPALPYDKPLGIKLETLDGPPFDLEAHRGKIVLLDVFATWCGPCREETPLIVKLAKEYAARGLYVVGINDQESDDAVRAYRKEFAVPYPIAMDRKGGLSRNLEGRGDDYLPATLIAGPRGFLRCYLLGERSAEEMRYRVERALAGSAPFLDAPTPTPSPAGEH